MGSAVLEIPTAKERISLPRLAALFLKIGGIGFGGGMAVIALMERELVQKRKAISIDEFVHGVGLGQILGSFAVNASFFLGYRLYGLAGGLLSAGAFLLPSVALVTALAELYFRYSAIPALQGAVAGLGPVAIALILDAGWSIGKKVLRSRYAVLIALGALAAGTMKINTVWVLLGAGAAGFLLPWRPAEKSSQAPAAEKRGRLAAGALAPVFGPAAGLLSVAATFFKIGLVFFGGGFVLIPVLHQRLVTDLHWLTPRQFIDGVAISNLTPGPIAVLATFAGYRVAGISGALAATAALMAPAILLMTLISRQYEHFRNDARARRFLAGVNPAVTGLVLSAALLLGGDALASWRGWLFGGAALLAMRKFRWHPALLLALGAAAGYVGMLP
jgi:chromate transporter